MVQESGKSPKEKSETTDLEKIGKEKNYLGKMKKMENLKISQTHRKKMEKSENQPDPPKENGKI